MPLCLAREAHHLTILLCCTSVPPFTFGCPHLLLICGSNGKGSDRRFYCAMNMWVHNAFLHVVIAAAVLCLLLVNLFLLPGFPFIYPWLKMGLDIILGMIDNEVLVWIHTQEPI